MGLTVAIHRNQSCSMRSRGRLMLDIKIETKKSGKALSTASTEPVLRASIAPIPPNPRATSTVSSTSTIIPGKPDFTSTPKRTPTIKKITPCISPRATTPASMPSRRAAGRMGVRESLSKKPLSMSRARSGRGGVAPRGAAGRGGGEEPAEEAALDVACEVGAGGDSAEERRLHEREGEREVEVGVGGEAGDARGGGEAVGVDGEEHHREQDRRDDDRWLP